MNRDLIQPEMVGLSDSHREIEMLTQYLFRFKHVVKPMNEKSQENLRERNIEIPEVLLTEKSSIESGMVLLLDHPFGIHVTLSFFEGENIYTFHKTGGHISNPLLVTSQRCDSPILSAEDEKVTTQEELIEKIVSRAPDGAMEFVRQFLSQHWR